MLVQSSLDATWQLCKDDIDGYNFAGRSDLVEYVDGKSPLRGSDWNELDYVSIL
jgi:hypothetical protein